MPLPEGYRPRKGDELLIRATVSFYVEPNDEEVHVRVGYHKIMIPLIEVQALHCRTWKDGDRVMIDHDHSRAVVIATYDSMVWVRRDIAPGDAEILQTWHANTLSPEPPMPESDVAYRNRILDECIDADLEAALINVASGADLDKIGDRFGLKRKGIER